MEITTLKSILPYWFKAILAGLVGLLLVLVLLVITAIVVLRSNPAYLEIAIEEIASTVLDRELQIGALVEAELGWDTYLLANNVSLANPDWAEEPDFARVGRLHLRINLPSIWRDGPIFIEELVLDNASLVLLPRSEQPANWDFWPADSEEDRSSAAEVTEGLAKVLFPIVIVEGQLSKGEITYRDSGRDVVISIDELALQEPGSDALVALDLAGAINDLPLVIAGNIGPSSALLTRRDIQLDLAVTLGKLSIEGRGSIVDPSNLSGVDLHLQIAAPESRPLLDLLGLSKIRSGPLSFEGHITDAQPGLAVDLIGAMGEFDLGFSGRISEPLAQDGIDIDFNVDGPSLAETGAVFGFPELSDIPYAVSGRIRRNGTVLEIHDGLLEAGPGRMAISGRLPNFPEIDDWDLTVEGTGFNLAALAPRIGIQDLPQLSYNINGHVSSNEEGVELVDLQVQRTGSSLLLSGIVGEGPDYLGSRIELEIAGESLLHAGSWLGVVNLPDLPFDVSGELSLDEFGWSLKGARYSTENLQLELEAQVDRLPKPTQLAVTLKVMSPDLATTLKEYGFEFEGLPAFPLSVEGSVSGSPTTMTITEAIASSGASQLNFSGLLGDPLALDGLDLAVVLNTPDLLKFFPTKKRVHQPALAVDVAGDVATAPGSLNIRGFRGQFGGAHLALDGMIDTGAPYDNSQLALSLNGANLGAVLGPWVQRDLFNAAFDLSLDANFQSGGVRFERLEGNVADTHLSASIDIDNLEDLTSVHGNIEISGLSSLNLVHSLGMESAIPDADYTLNVGIQKTQDRLRLKPMTLAWGKSDYSGSVEIQTGDVPKVVVDLHSEFISLPFLLPDMGELEKELTARAEVEGAGEESVLTEKLTRKELSERVIPNEALDFSWLNNLEATVKYRADDIYISPEARSSANIDLSIADGILSTREFSWDGTFSAGEAELTVRALAEGAEIDAYLDLEQIPLMVLLGGHPEHQPGSFYRARVRAQGNTFRELANSSNGALVFKGGGGRLDNNGIDLVLGDVLEELFDRLNPFSDTDPYTQVVCHAGAMTIENGNAAVAPGLIIRTEKMDIASGGTISLHSERLNLDFNTRSRKGIGISAGKAITPYFKIGGTLANPRLALDAKGVALSGGAAVATVGLSILAEGLWDRWIATAGNPCESLIDQLSTEKNSAYKPLLTPRL